MMSKVAGEWQTCVCDKDYEIYSEYPYQIRRKSNRRIISESIDNGGYVRCCLNRRSYRKHRIVAMQFLPNPNNYDEIDHINGDRTDYHLNNLRWCSRSENLKNRSGYGHKYVFHDELPESAESLDSYSGHDLDGVFVDYERQKLYLFNGIKYRELIPCRSNGNIYYLVQDIENKQVHLYHKVIFG